MASPLTARRVLTVALLLLVVLHVFPLPLCEPDQLLAGFIPWDLAYPLAWMAVASLVVVYMTTAPWPDEPPPPPQPPIHGGEPWGGERSGGERSRGERSGDER